MLSDHCRNILIKKIRCARDKLPKYMCMKDEWKEKLQYHTHFYMDLNWRKQYVGVLEMEYDGIKFYFIDNEYYFNGYAPYGDMYADIEKFAFFSKAVLSALPLIDFRPDIIHCHDWQTGLVPIYLDNFRYGNEFYRGIKTVMTIHNLKFQEHGIRSVSETLPDYHSIISHRISWKHTRMQTT